MLSNNRVQEPDVNPGQVSRPLCVLLGRISEVDHDPRHKVTSPLGKQVTTRTIMTTSSGGSETIKAEGLKFN